MKKSFAFSSCEIMQQDKDTKTASYSFFSYFIQKFGKNCCQEQRLSPLE